MKFKQAISKPSIIDNQAIAQHKRRAIWQTMLQDSQTRALSRIVRKPVAY